jgi:hypothetical protein
MLCGAAEFDSRTRWLPWPARRGRVTRAFKPRRTPRVPHPSPSRLMPCALPSPETLTRRCCSPPPSSPHRQRGAVQDLRKEVRRPPDARVVAARAVSPVEAITGFRRRAEPRRHVPAATAALGSFAVPRAARRCSPRLKLSSKTLDWVPPASRAAGRRRWPSPTAGQPLTRVLRRRIKIRSA